MATALAWWVNLCLQHLHHMGVGLSSGLSTSDPAPQINVPGNAAEDSPSAWVCQSGSMEAAAVHPVYPAFSLTQPLTGTIWRVNQHSISLL